MSDNHGAVQIAESFLIYVKLSHGFSEFIKEAEMVKCANFYYLICSR